MKAKQTSKTGKTPVTALVIPSKRNALKSVLASRGESIQDWLERLIDKEIKWNGKAI